MTEQAECEHVCVTPSPNERETRRQARGLLGATPEQLGRMPTLGIPTTQPGGCPINRLLPGISPHLSDYALRTNTKETSTKENTKSPMGRKVIHVLNILALHVQVRERIKYKICDRMTLSHH